MKKIFYLMRHGQTLFNVRRKIQGVCDSPLTKLGKKQCEKAGEYFKDIEIDHYYSSTSERASDTLEIVTDYKVPYTRLKGIKEMNFGVFEGESEDLFTPNFDSNSEFFVPFGGESIEDVTKRMVNTCTEIMEKDDHEVVLAVSHGVACTYFLNVWADAAKIIKNGMPNCTIFKYEYEDKKFRLLEIITPNFE